MHALDELLLILGGGADRGTLGGLGLVTAAHGEPGAGEHGAESGHGELLRGQLVSWRLLSKEEKIERQE